MTIAATSVPGRPAIRRTDLPTAGRLVAGTQLWFERPATAFFVDQAESGQTALRSDPVVLGMGFFLILRDDEITLVDTGIGHATPEGMVATGAAPETALKAVGAATTDVRRVIITHLHGDHCGGVLTPENALAFPDAEHVIHAEEIAYWQPQSTAAAHKASMVIGALQAADILREVDGPVTAIDGVRVRHTPGHTPGHQSVDVLARDGALEAVILGDLIHHALQLADPGVGVGADVDPQTALGTRQQQLERLADARVAVGAGHLADTPLLTVETREGGGYRAVALGTPL